MSIKHKVIKEFQFLSPDKKIFILKSGTILEGYKYKIKNESIDIDKDIIDNNPEFFETISWREELLVYMKVNKIPQPSQVLKKMIPFIEDMILSDMNSNKSIVEVVSIDPQIEDDLKSRESKLEKLESDLKSKERRIKDKEDEIDIRLKRIEKREQEYKNDLELIDKKEDEIRILSKELIEKQLNLEDSVQDLNERERNFDRSLLESSKDYDSKWSDLQNKIDVDLKSLSEREREVEFLMKDIKNKEIEILSKESTTEENLRNVEIKLEEISNRENDLKRLESKLKDSSICWRCGSDLLSKRS